MPVSGPGHMSQVLVVLATVSFSMFLVQHRRERSLLGGSGSDLWMPPIVCGAISGV
jgi:hypothetical protein